MQTSKKVILREFEGRMTTLTTSDLHHQHIDLSHKFTNEPLVVEWNNLQREEGKQYPSGDAKRAAKVFGFALSP